MSYPAVVLADSPQFYFRMDDTSGATCTALAGGNGTYLNAPTLGVPGCTTDGDTAVRLAAASSQGVQFPNSTIVDVFTLECWVKRTTLNAAFNTLLTIPGNNAYMRIDNTDTISVQQLGISNIGTTTVTIVDTTTFHHVVWTKNGATNHIYLDSVDVTPAITNATLSHVSGSVSYMGQTDLNQLYLNGTIDEVAVYPTALTAARVAAHYAAATTPLSSPGRKKSPPPSLVARLGKVPHPVHPPHPSPSPSPPPPPPVSPPPSTSPLPEFVQGERLKNEGS